MNEPADPDPPETLLSKPFVYDLCKKQNKKENITSELFDERQV